MTFADFFASYPRRIKRAAAQKAWDKHIKTPADAERAMNALESYKLCEWAKRPKEYIPHASTFLNQGYWQDEEFDGNDLESVPEPTSLRKTACPGHICGSCEYDHVHYCDSVSCEAEPKRCEAWK